MFAKPSVTTASTPELEPTELNTGHHGPGLEISKDKLTVRYVGEARHSNDVGAIQANRPLPLKRLVYYFELRVLDGTEGTCSISIGFTHKNFNVTKHPGSEANSYGYLGEDGRKYQQGSKGEEYGLAFGKGDTIGAGIHLPRQEIFFTRNGIKLKTAFFGVKGTLYPTVSLHCKNEAVEVNLGRSPFKFDLEGMISDERKEQQQQVASIPVSSGVAHQVVRDYLLHYGYAETLAAFDQAAGLTGNGCEMQDTAALTQRQEIRSVIVSGHIDTAITLLQKYFPDMLGNKQGALEMMFCLHCQKYLELIRHRQVDAAMDYLQTTLTQCQSQCPHLEASLKEVVAIIAYEQPESSPLSHFLLQSHREAVADVVNTATLAHVQGTPSAAPKSLLESLLRQLLTVHQTLVEENGGQGEVLRLQDHLGDSRRMEFGFPSEAG